MCRGMHRDGEILQTRMSNTKVDINDHRCKECAGGRGADMMVGHSSLSCRQVYQHRIANVAEAMITDLLEVNGRVEGSVD